MPMTSAALKKFIQKINNELKSIKNMTAETVKLTAMAAVSHKYTTFSND